MKTTNKIFGFTLIEIMLGILIFSMVIIGGFQAFSSVNIGKLKLMQRVSTEKQNIYFIEKFFEEIKKGGTIDYEEYFNRKLVGTNFSSGHYLEETGFGNFGQGGTLGITTYGTGFYYCRSDNGNSMSNTGSNPDLGCFNDGTYNNSGNPQNGEPQRYGEYSFQFIDYNSNADDDLGDEDGDLKIIGDDDDEFLGKGPIVFSGGTDIKELYLISGNKIERTLFRWKVEEDPNKPSGTNCTSVDGITFTGSGCLGTIEMLKLEGKDWGMDHTSGSNDSDKTESDGVIDTWVINPDFDPNYNLTNIVIAGSNTNNYWLPIFPDTININDFKVFLYPNIDSTLSWKDTNADIRISPYVKINISMLPSWKARRGLKGNPSTVSFSTTISLTDIFSK